MEKMRLDDLVAESQKRPWRPEPFWERAGDSLFYYFRNLSYEEQRIDKYLTVFRADADGELVGVQIKGFMQLLKEKPILGLIFDDGTTKLGMIALTVRGVEGMEKFVDEDVRRLAYDQVLTRAGRRKIKEPALSY